MSLKAFDILENSFVIVILITGKRVPFFIAKKEESKVAGATNLLGLELKEALMDLSLIKSLYGGNPPHNFLISNDSESVDERVSSIEKITSTELENLEASFQIKYKKDIQDIESFENFFKHNKN